MEARKKELEISILQEQIKRPFLEKEQIQFGIEKFKKLDLSTKDGRQRMIDGFVNAIYLYDDKIKFAFNYREGTYTVSLEDLEGSMGSDIKLLAAPSRTELNRSRRRSPDDYRRGFYYACICNVFQSYCHKELSVE